MSGRYGRTELYTSKFPPRLQVVLCSYCTLLYGVEMLGLLSGQRVVQLSELFYGKANRFCAEHLWPSTLAYGEWRPDGTADRDGNRALALTPDRVCFDDAAGNVLTSSGALLDRSIQGIKNEIDAGHCLALYVPPNHAEIAWDYDDFGVLGLDSRNDRPEPVHTDWSMTVDYVESVYRIASLSGRVTPHRINPFMPNNNASIVRAMRARLQQIDPAVAAPLLNKLNSLLSITATDIAQMWAMVDAIVAPIVHINMLSSMVNALVPDTSSIPATDEWDALIAQMRALETSLETL